MFNKPFAPVLINIIEHEGFTYVEFNGEYFKGCQRCGGTGHYLHNGEHSRCYTCDNGDSARLGDHLASKEAAEKWCHGKAMARARRERKREAERLQRVAQAEANQHDLRAAAPDVYEFLMGIVIEDDTQDQFDSYEEWAKAQAYGQPGRKLERNGFLRTMAETLRWVGPSKPFTPRMIESVREAMVKRQSQQAASAASPVPEGRQEVQGTIVGAKLVDGEYGESYKVTIRDDRGFRVYLSLPRTLREAAYGIFLDKLEADGQSTSAFGYACWFLGADDGYYAGVKGMRVRLTATLTQSGDDPGFGFGSRPTKAELI